MNCIELMAEIDQLAFKLGTEDTHRIKWQAWDAAHPIPKGQGWSGVCAKCQPEVAKLFPSHVRR